MNKTKNKIIGFIKIDHILDLITNSSSELFVIKNTMEKNILIELVNTALKGFDKITDNSIEERFKKDGDFYSQDYDKEQILNYFPEELRDEIQEKYLTKPNYYGISFDRDWIYSLDNNKNFSVREKLKEIGFELIDTDY